MDDRRTAIDREITSLLCALSSSASDIGDWKISKIYEYRMTGQEDPYDFNELVAKRQAARDRINELQAKLKEIEAEKALNSEQTS